MGAWTRWRWWGVARFWIQKLRVFSEHEVQDLSSPSSISVHVLGACVTGILLLWRQLPGPQPPWGNTYQTCRHQELLLAASFVSSAGRWVEAFILIRLHRVPSSVCLPWLTWGRIRGWWWKGRQPQADKYESEQTGGSLWGPSERRRERNRICRRCCGGEETAEGCLVVGDWFGNRSCGLRLP